MHQRNLLAAAVIAAFALFISACSRPTEEQSDQAAASATDAGSADSDDGTDGGEYESLEERASYGIGFNVGTSIRNQGGIDLDREAFNTGLEDALSKSNSRIEMELVREALDEVQERARAARAAAAAENLEKANAFLEENAKREGVIVTESGLQYEILEQGYGMKPTKEHKVEVHYHGTLIDGTVFDSSVDRGETIEFMVTGVIRGWTEALQMMPIGSKWRLYIPPSLGYGGNNNGMIPPNSALIFEVELIAIKQP